MDRRTAIARVALILGSTIVGADLFISGCTVDNARKPAYILSDAQIGYLNEVGEIILPRTAKSEGAKAANVGLFMKTMVRDCYDANDQKIFSDGLAELERRAEQMFNQGFLKCDAQQRHALLVALDDEEKDLKKKNELLKQREADRQKTAQASGKPNYLKKDLPTSYFAMIKQLTLLGYFTSEIGYKSLGYVPVPGRYDGDVVHRTSGA